MPACYFGFRWYKQSFCLDSPVKLMSSHSFSSLFFILWYFLLSHSHSLIHKHTINKWQYPRRRVDFLLVTPGDLLHVSSVRWRSMHTNCTYKLGVIFQAKWTFLLFCFCLVCLIVATWFETTHIYVYEHECNIKQYYL